MHTFLFIKFKFALFKMSQHKAIIYLLCMGKTNPEIVKLLKAPKSTVQDAVNTIGCKSECKLIHQGHLTPALVEMKKHFRDEVFTFQQDGAPLHTANKTQTWCEHHFPRFWRKELWPLSSADLNPLDFCILSILEKEASATAHTNTEALKKSLK